MVTDTTATVDQGPGELAPGERVSPSREDPFAGGASRLVGGPPGTHARLPSRRTWWTALRILMLFTLLTCTFGYAQKATCRDTRNWAHEYQYTRMCYSDVVALYGQEGLEQGKRPYLDYPTEYPPLIGATMQLASSFAIHASPSEPVYETQNGKPVLVGYSMDHRAALFFDVTALLFAIAACVAVLCTALAAGRTRYFDAALFALAPGLLLHLLTNWDIVAVAFAAGAILAWSRRAPKLAGLMIGLGAATKFYPLLFLVPLAVLCFRAGRLREFGRTLVTAVLTLVAVVIPVWTVAGLFNGNVRVGASIWNTLSSGGDWTALIGGHGGGGSNGVLRFVDLNRTRTADWDSLAFGLEWLVRVHSPNAWAPVHLIAILLTLALLAGAGYLLIRYYTGGGWVRPVSLAVGLAILAFVVFGVPPVLRSVREHGIPAPTLNTVTAVVLIVLLGAIAALALAAPRRPRLPQLLFLTITAFLVSNKVFSPQYVLWLIPLAALARPRWRMFLFWQATEALVLFTRFMHFIFNDTNGARGIDRGWFVGAVTLRDVTLLVFAGLVVREILAPEHDVVRATVVGGVALDDPAGGVLDGAPDVRPLHPEPVGAVDPVLGPGGPGAIAGSVAAVG
ncbi:MAG: glycosyltransferase family 87 protein [Frankia sp.]